MPCGVPPVVDIFRSGSWRSMIRPPTAGAIMLGHDERLAVALVEALGDVACELDVLALVLADRDRVGLVEQDVRRLEHGVAEEAGRDEVLPVALVLELGHPAQLAVARDRAEQPGRLGMRGHVALDEDVERFASRPVAKSIAARSSVALRSSAGSYSTVIECRSTMQKNASPCSCVAAYWRKPRSSSRDACRRSAGCPRRSAWTDGNYTPRTMAVTGSPELLVVMGANATPEQVEEVVARIPRPARTRT